MTDKINEVSEEIEESTASEASAETEETATAHTPADEQELDASEELEETEESEENDPDTPAEKPSLLKNIFEWVEMFSIYFAVGIAVLMLFFRHCPVNGKSMMNTLKHEDMLILYTFNYTPENGDMIVCQSEKYGLEKPLVKRVIATGGQTVKIDYKNWTVSVDGVMLEEDYIWKRDGVAMLDPDRIYQTEEIKVPEGYLFVMGDNRNDSADSRDDRIGFIDERYVVGKVCARILPISDFTIFD